MKTNHRHSIRLKGFDYSQEGLYFVTVCTKDREHIFGDIENGCLNLNPCGKMIRDDWLNLTNRFKHIELDEFILMPNHFHGIVFVGATLVVAQNIRAGTRPAPTGSPISLGNVIGAFKSITTHKFIQNINTHKWPRFNKRLWQRNYYEHIIRNERDYFAIKQYIEDNPKNWERDELFN